MSDDTCVDPECGAPGDFARGYCSLHYGRLWRSGDLPPLRPPRPRHEISNADLEAKLGDCSVCGPRVRLRLRERKGGTIGVFCRQGDRGPGPRRRPRPHKRLRSGSGFAWHGWSKYGITVEEYEVRLQAQGGKCLICKEPMGRPMIDHDHENGHVRGILCQHCNTGLGMFRDNPEALLAAAKYVRRYLNAAA